MLKKLLIFKKIRQKNDEFSFKTLAQHSGNLLKQDTVEKFMLNLTYFTCFK